MISEHTKLINCFIGYTKLDRKFPSFLRELGYSIDSIEPNFRTFENEVVNPDILITSNKIHHSLIIESKGGGINNEKQIENYKNIKKENFIHLTCSKESEKLKFDIALACIHTNMEKIGQCPYIKDIPLIVHDLTRVYLSDKHGKFGSPHLNKLFEEPIQIPKHYPTNYYPFGCDDDIRHISIHILRSIVQLSLKVQEFTDEDILKNSHQLWDKFDKTHQKKMKGKLRNLMTSNHFSKISNYLDMRKKKYKVSTRTLQSLQDACDSLSQELQNNSEQQLLSNY